MADVLTYIEQNGLMISPRWKISEEDNTGRLFVRDILASEGTNVDARYTFRNGTMVNL